MPGKYGIEKSTWNRYDLTDEQGNDIMDRVAALETKVASMTGGDGIFPVGTVLCFADDSINAGKLHTLYGGVWKLYAQGRTLVGAVWDSPTSKGYSTKMSKANTVYDPPGQQYANGTTYTDSATQHDAGTDFTAIPLNEHWYAKMDNNSLVAHSHTGVENNPGHWHKIWSRQSYDGQDKPDSKYIYQDYNGNEGTDTRKIWGQFPTKVDNFSGQYNHTLATDYPVNGTETSEGRYSKEGRVHVTTDTQGNSEAKLGTWQPFITVWFYKRVE